MTSDTTERAARRAAREEEERRSDEADAARRTEKELRLREARRNRPTTYIASWVASTDFRNDISFGLNPGHRGNWDSLCDHGMGPGEDFVQFGSWPRGAVCRDHGERTIERLKEAALTRTHAFYASGYAPKGGGEWQLVGREWKDDGRGRETWAYRTKRGKPLAAVTIVGVPSFDDWFEAGWDVGDENPVDWK